jgi:dihydroxyacid dehydratase/phosphogluconate dehydratase
MVMGTASTMACVTEALGLSLPGSAAIPAADSRREHDAEAAGRQIVSLVRSGLRPSDLVTRASLENAIRALHAISGSTNAIIHLIAYAGRLGIDLPLALFDELCVTTPWLVNLKPAGERLMEDFYYAGGLPAVLDQIRDLLHLDALTVTAKTLGENLESVPTEIVDREVIHTRSEPLDEGGALVVLRGNLCPDGAVMKISAADHRLLAHEGTAIVFEDIHDLAMRVDDPTLDVDQNTVMVLRNAGPVGAPGMPEWGHLPIPAKLLKAGVTDLLRISDARMSGTSYGAVVLHVAPESAVGGPLALVHSGDRIRLDVERRSLDVVVDDAELQRRREAWTPPEPKDERGYRQLYEQHVLQANEGCDLDFLRGRSPVIADAVTYL